MTRELELCVNIPQKEKINEPIVVVTGYLLSWGVVNTILCTFGKFCNSFIWKDEPFVVRTNLNLFMGLLFTQGLFDKAHCVSFTNLDTRVTDVNQTRSLLSRTYFYGRRQTYDVLEKHILKWFRNTIKTIKQGNQNHYIIFPCLLNIYSRPTKGWKRKQATSRKGSHFIQK